MILISGIRISAFRSLLDIRINQLGNMTALVGKNSSGKSNILRALNLFFNDEVQPGAQIAFPRDVFDVPKQRKKKRISIEVDFSLPPSFRLRKQLESLAVLGRAFTIKRTWELDNQRRVLSSYGAEVEGAPIANASDIARQFLGLVTFRYIPNRTVPTEILRDESQALASSVFLRMKDQTHAGALLTELAKAAERMLSHASHSMMSLDAPITKPTVTTSELTQMLSMSGFQAQGRHGGLVRDAEWGAGHQAFFLYNVLCTLDSDYSRFFGWRQATVWAVEEPESALHRDLEIALAAQLRQWTNDPQFRLQILVTTHSPVFSMASDVGGWVDLTGASSTLSQMPIHRLTRAAETEGVSGYTHPILSHPWNPVVLVEGPNDVEALSHVAGLAGFDRLRFAALPALDTDEQGSGKDSIISYLKKHSALLANRQREAPLLVLLDWEVSKVDLNKARNAYGPGAQERVTRMDARYCDPLMGTDFKGIERFYPPRILREAQAASELMLAVSSGKPYSISKGQLDASKHALVRRLKEVTSPTELLPLVNVLKDLDRASNSMLDIQRSFFDEDLGETTDT